MSESKLMNPKISSTYRFDLERKMLDNGLYEVNKELYFEIIIIVSFIAFYLQKYNNRFLDLWAGPILLCT
jgi:hypothetical protein